jgi:hypothetical protein
MNVSRFTILSRALAVVAMMTLTAVCAHATDFLVGNFVGGDESVKRKIVASRHTLA